MIVKTEYTFIYEVWWDSVFLTVLTREIYIRKRVKLNKGIKVVENAL
jgi:hypothetical protein